MSRTMLHGGWLSLVGGLAVLGGTVGGIGCSAVLGIEPTVLELDSKCALMRYRVFFADKPIEDTSLTVSIPTGAQFNKIASDLGVGIDPTKGHALARLIDCENEPLDDATLFSTATSSATSFIINDNGALLGADTSESGLIGLFNVDAPTELELQARPDDFGDKTSSKGDLGTGAAQLSFIDLRPNSDVEDSDPNAPEHLDCVGMVEPMDTTPGTFVITVSVRNAPSLHPDGGQPFAGARVRACYDRPEPCDIDLNAEVDSREAVTDRDGLAQLIVDKDTEGFDGYVLIAGLVEGCTE